MQIIELDRRVNQIQRNFDFQRECRNVSELLLALNSMGWNIDIRETENQLRVDFLDFPNEHPHFITTHCKDKELLFSRLNRKISSMNLGGAA